MDRVQVHRPIVFSLPPILAESFALRLLLPPLLVVLLLLLIIQVLVLLLC